MWLGKRHWIWIGARSLRIKTTLLIWIGRDLLRIDRWQNQAGDRFLRLGPVLVVRHVK